MLVQDNLNLLDKIINARVALNAAEDELMRAEDDLDYVPQWQRFQDAKRARKQAKKDLERAISDAVDAVQERMEFGPEVREAARRFQETGARVVVAETA